MKDAYQNEYMDDEFPHVTEAWDKVQDEVCICIFMYFCRKVESNWLKNTV